MFLFLWLRGCQPADHTRLRESRRQQIENRHNAMDRIHLERTEIKTKSKNVFSNVIIQRSINYLSIDKFNKSCIKLHIKLHQLKCNSMGSNNRCCEEVTIPWCLDIIIIKFILINTHFLKIKWSQRFIATNRCETDVIFSGFGKLGFPKAFRETNENAHGKPRGGWTELIDLGESRSLTD